MVWKSADTCCTRMGRCNLRSEIDSGKNEWLIKALTHFALGMNGRMPSKIFAWRRDEVPIDRNVILLSNIKSLCRKFDFVSEQTQSHQCCFYLCASFAYLRRYVHINIYVHKPVVFKGMNRVCGFWASRMHQISSAGFKDVRRVKWLNQMFFLSFRQI